MSLAAGSRLGPYEIISPLGAGGMGEVYRAVDTNLGRQVAIKVLPDALAHDVERIARFDREARTLATLNHPNIAAIYGLERGAAVTGLVMELVEGDTLADRIARGPLALDDALAIARQVAEALEAAHEHGIVHRDLKPANIKVRPDGTVKVLDFGLAKALDPTATSGLGANASMSPTLTSPALVTGVATVLGTAAYMAPEQAAGKLVDRRADIWAYGVVLWEMLTGRRLFDGDSVAETLAAVLRAPIELEQLPATTPRSIRDLIGRCLDRSVNTRLRDVGEARILIAKYLAHPIEATPPPVQVRPVRSTMAWAAVAVLAAVAAAASYLAYSATPPALDQPLLRFAADLGSELSLAGLEGSSLAMSADGSRLAYIVAIDGTTRVAVKTLQSDSLTILNGTDGAHSPFLSPDGRWVGFLSGTALKKIAIDGGTAVLLHDQGATVRGGGFWGDDGNIYFAGQRTPVMRIPAEGGTPANVTELDEQAGDVSHRSAQLLPGSAAILFTASNDNNAWNDGTIQVQSLADGRRQTLVRGGYAARYLPGRDPQSGHLLYIRDETLFAAPMDVKRLELTGTTVPVVQDVSSRAANGLAHYDVTGSGTLVYVPGGSEANSASLVWREVNGREEPLPAALSQAYLFPRISPDGARIAVVAADGSSFNLMLYEWRQNRMTRLTYARGVNGPLAWTPDGRYIAFSLGSADLSGPGVYFVRADGGGEPQQLIPGRALTAYSFSPDGRRLAYSRAEGGFGLFTVALDWTDPQRPKAATPELFLEGKGDVRAPAFSPDGRWLAYRSSESGRFEIFVRPFPGPGGRWQVSTAGGTLPSWSNRGELFFQADDGMLMVTAYSVNGDAFVAGQPRAWWPERLPGGFGQFDVAPDGTRAIMTRSRDPRAGVNQVTHATFLLNFADELRRKTAAR